jgi:hypothetical protein
MPRTDPQQRQGKLMASGMFMAWSSPVSAEADADFNRWYDEVHAPQVRAAIPSITEVRRYTLLGTGEDGTVKRYLACYDLGECDAAEAAVAMHAAVASGAFDMSSTIDLSEPPQMYFLDHVE